MCTVIGDTVLMGKLVTSGDMIASSVRVINEKERERRAPKAQRGVGSGEGVSPSPVGRDLGRGPRLYALVVSICLSVCRKMRTQKRDFLKMVSIDGPTGSPTWAFQTNYWTPKIKDGGHPPS